MQALQDIFGLWPSISVMAESIGAKTDTVRKWKKSGRIPEDSWEVVIDAAGMKGATLTIADLHAANRPSRPRGRPAHKVRSIRRRRTEPRAAE
jgi:hypothetical protein